MNRKEKLKRIFTLANLLSFSRIFMAIPLVMALDKGWFDESIRMMVCAGIILAIFLSDVLDGALARWMDQVSNVGKVIALGKDVTEFSIGDRVASNGNHAEYVCVPKNLVVNIPKNVSDEEASFTVVGSIGLQGIRLLNPTFGETIVVIGLGLIGLITAEL